MMGGKRGNPHVNLLVADLLNDPAILRDTPLGDVHVRHDLHARKDGQRKMDGWRCHFVESSIDPIADLEVLFKRLEMDVRSFLLNCLIENQIDVADDGGRVVWRHDDIDFPSKCEAQIFGSLRIQRIHEGHIESGFVEIYGKCPVESRGAGRN